LTSLFALLEEWQNHLFVSQYKKNCFPSNRWNISKIFEWTSHIMALPPQKCVSKFYIFFSRYLTYTHIGQQSVYFVFMYAAANLISTYIPQVSFLKLC
jgi:hypothetical protein